MDYAAAKQIEPSRADLAFALCTVVYKKKRFLDFLQYDLVHQKDDGMLFPSIKYRHNSASVTSFPRFLFSQLPLINNPQLCR